MKKMMYAVLVLMMSCLILTAWTTENKSQPAQSVSTNSVNSDEENIIYITKEGYDNPDFWVGKTQPVTWINVDPSGVHSVTDDYGEFDSGPLKTGESFTISFSHAGVWTYHDNYSQATGMISVFGRDE